MNQSNLQCGCCMRACVCPSSLSLCLSSDVLTAHSAGLIFLLVLCESRLINTHIQRRLRASQRVLAPLHHQHMTQARKTAANSGLRLRSPRKPLVDTNSAIHKYVTLSLFWAKEKRKKTVLPVLIVHLLLHMMMVKMVMMSKWQHWCIFSSDGAEKRSKLRPQTLTVTADDARLAAATTTLLRSEESALLSAYQPTALAVKLPFTNGYSC